MCKSFRYTASAVAMLISTTLSAQRPFKFQEKSSITIRPASTAAEQLKQAAHVWRMMSIASDAEKRRRGYSEAMINLDLVAKLWPSDTAAVLEAATMQADLSMEVGQPANAIAALQPYSEWAASTPLYPGVQRRLAEAYVAIGNDTEAENHFLLAERSIQKSRVGRIEAEAVLGAIAHFYADHGNPHESMKRYDSLAKLPDQTTVNKVTFALGKLKQAVELKDDQDLKNAKGAFADLEDSVIDARGKSLKPEEAATIEAAYRDAQDIRRKRHF